MDADKDRVWIDEIELHIPPVALKNVDVDTRNSVVWRTLMMLTAAVFDDLEKFIRCDLPHLKQVLRVYLTPSFMQKRALLKRLDQASSCLLETNPYNQYTTILVNIKLDPAESFLFCA